LAQAILDLAPCYLPSAASCPPGLPQGASFVPMAPKAMKRPAAAGAAGVAKKPASAKSGVAKHCNVVGKAVLKAQSFPGPVLEMLNTSLPDSLGAPKEERHPFQEQVIQMVEEVLKSLESGIQDKIAACQTKLDEANDEKEKRTKAEEAAAIELVQRSEALDAAKAALSDSSATLGVAKGALATSQAEQKAGDAEVDAAASKRERILSTVAETFTPLKDGTAEAGKVKDKAAAFVKLGKELAFDASLLNSLPIVLSKTPSEHGVFDTMALKQVDAELEQRTEALDEMIANGEPSKKERAAKVEAAAQAAAEAGNAEMACKAKVEAAQKEKKEAVEGQKAANKAIQHFEPEMRQVALDLESAKAELEELKEGPLASFKELLERTAIPPPAPAPEEGAAAEAEAAPETAAQEPCAEEAAEPEA